MNQGALVMVLRKLFWIICSFFMFVLAALIQMGDAYSSKGLIIVLYIVKADL